MKKTFCIIFFVNLFFIENSYAYLDPGMGSIILQSILGGIFAGIAYISLYWRKFKNLFKIFKKKKIEPSEKK